VRRVLSTEWVEKDPHLIWNTFIDLVGTEDYKDLSIIQRTAHLVFIYESEVQNGGHFQYFANGGANLLKETIDALTVLGLPCQATVLQRAASRWESRERGSVQSSEAFHARALEGEFEEFDHAYYACVPSVIESLEQHLQSHLSDYIEFR